MSNLQRISKRCINTYIVVKNNIYETYQKIEFHDYRNGIILYCYKFTRNTNCVTIRITGIKYYYA